jgi:hypothetical protein
VRDYSIWVLLTGRGADRPAGGPLCTLTQRVHVDGAMLAVITYEIRYSLTEDLSAQCVKMKTWDMWSAEELGIDYAWIGKSVK